MPASSSRVRQQLRPEELRAHLIPGQVQGQQHSLAGLNAPGVLHEVGKLTEDAQNKVVAAITATV